MTNQLQNAASSVGAKYRASGRARSQAEFTAKIGVANEEADEAVYWPDREIERSRDREIER
jgi:four helix bundle protein